MRRTVTAGFGDRRPRAPAIPLNAIACSLVVGFAVIGCADVPRPPIQSSPTTALRPTSLASDPFPGSGTALPSVALPTPTPAPTAVVGETIKLTMDDGAAVPVVVADPGSVDLGPRPATAAERTAGGRAIADASDTGAVALDADQLLISWVGTVCERGYSLVVSAEGAVITPRPRPGCDLGRQLFAVVVRLPGVDPGAFAIDLERPALTGG
jgi:hypothetical protein